MLGLNDLLKDGESDGLNDGLILRLNDLLGDMLRLGLNDFDALDLEDIFDADEDTLCGGLLYMFLETDVLGEILNAIDAVFGLPNISFPVFSTIGIWTFLFSFSDVIMSFC